MNGYAAIGKATALADSGALVAAVAGRRINVLGFYVSAAAAVTVKFQSSGGADISAPMFLAITGGFSVPANDKGWGITTAVGEGLNMNLSTPASVGVQVLYEVL